VRIVNPGRFCLLALLSVAGCTESTAPWGPQQPIDASPVASTPELAIRSVVWSWNRKSVDVYSRLFSNDYRFAFSALDPAGDAYRGDIWNREDEMIFAQHLFVGGNPTEPPATSIQLTFGSLEAKADPRPGRDPRWHKYFTTTLTLVVITPDKQTNINGPASFYLVRGDSAQVPTGSPRDSTHWYIDRWEDGTAGGPGGLAQAMPARNATMGHLKVLYRGTPVVAISRRPML